MTSSGSFKNGVLYGVNLFPLAAGLPADLARMAAAAKGDLVSTTPTTFQGFQALEAVTKRDTGTLHQLLVRAPDRIVQLLVIGDDATDYTRFRDSLEIL